MTSRKAISGLLKHPLFWLLGVFLAVWGNLRRANLLVPKFSPDAVSYDLLSRSDSLTEALSSVRTLGYPMFLKLLRSFSPDYHAAPTAHLVIYFAVVTLFWWSMRRYTGSRWLAFAWAVPLAYPCNLAFIKYVQPDFLGPAVAIGALALLILLVGRPNDPFAWILLAGATFCAYQVRPDNLFLVALLPPGGVLLLLCRRTLDPIRLLRFGVGVAAITVVPLILFMTLRWGVVGQFGLVSFGGYNLIGVTSSFLDQELVQELPEEQKALAREILERRSARKNRPYRASSWTKQWYRQYSPNVWHVAEPIARKLLTEAQTTRVDGVDVPPLTGEAVFTINRAFKQLSREIIARRPILYLKWVHDGVVAGCGTVFQCATFGQLIILFVLSVPFLVGRARQRDRVDPRIATDRVLHLFGISVVAAAYFFGRLLLTVLVNEPSVRFVLPGMVFLPCLLTASLFEAWRWILSPRLQD